MHQNIVNTVVKERVNIQERGREGGSEMEEGEREWKRESGAEDG